MTDFNAGVALVDAAVAKLVANPEKLGFAGPRSARAFLAKCDQSPGFARAQFYARVLKGRNDLPVYTDHVAIWLDKIDRSSRD